MTGANPLESSSQTGNGPEHSQAICGYFPGCVILSYTPMVSIPTPGKALATACHHVCVSLISRVNALNFISIQKNINIQEMWCCLTLILVLPTKIDMSNFRRNLAPKQWQYRIIESPHHHIPVKPQVEIGSPLFLPRTYGKTANDVFLIYALQIVEPHSQVWPVSIISTSVTPGPTPIPPLSDPMLTVSHTAGRLCGGYFWDNWWCRGPQSKNPFGAGLCMFLLQFDHFWIWLL